MTIARVLLGGALAMVLTGAAAHREAHRDARRPSAAEDVFSFAVTYRGSLTCVRAAGRDEGCFDVVDRASLTYSDRGDHHAYAARVGQGWTIVRDGQPDAWWAAVGRPVLSPDGTRLAYPARDARGWHVVVDGVAGAAFTRLWNGSLRFDSTGRHVTYLTVGDSVRVVTDGRASPGWQHVAYLTTAADGRMAYAGRRGSAWHAVVDGTIGRAHSHIDTVVLARTADGAPSSAYSARDGRESRVYENGVAGPAFASTRRLAYSSKGVLHYVAVRRFEGQHREELWRAGRHVATFDAVMQLACAPDGPCGVVAGDHGHTVIVVEDVTIAVLEVESELALGAGGRTAYSFVDGETQVLFDEHGRHEVPNLVRGTLQYVHGGTAWAALVEDASAPEGYTAVLDGRPVDAAVQWREFVNPLEPSGISVTRAWVRRVMERAAGLTAPPAAAPR